MIFVFLLFFVYLQSQGALAITPAWTTSPYLQTGSKKIIDSFLCNCVATNFSVPNATTTFSSAFSSAPNVAYGLTNYEGRDGIFSQGFEIRILSKTQSSLSLSVTISLITNILSLQVRYLAIDKQFPYHINAFANLPVNYLKGALTNLTTSSTLNNTYTNVVNYTAQCQLINSSYNKFTAPFANNKVVLFLNALIHKAENDVGIAAAPALLGALGDTKPQYVQLGSNAVPQGTVVPINLIINATVLSQENYSIKVIHGIKANISKLHFSMVVYDQNNVQSSGIHFIISDQVCFSKIGGFYSFSSQFFSNFIIGLLQFSSKRTFALISFQNMFLTTNNTFGVQMPPSYVNGSAPGYDSIEQYCFSIFYLKTFACPIKTYFQSSLGECLDCSTNCLSCQKILGTIQCQICNTSALYFLNPSNFQCEVCSLANCIQCSSFSSCSVCSSTDGYFLNQTTLLCEPCNLPDCITCASLTTCQICNETDGIIVRNPLTLQCEIYSPTGEQSCSNNILQITEQCDDGNKQNGDGCSQQCIVQKDFSCQISTISGQPNSICFYTGLINLQVKQIQKLDDSNKISIILDIFPKQMAFWNNINFEQMISISGLEGWQDFEVSRNLDGTISLLISYNYNIHNKSITVQLDPKKSSRLSLSRAMSASRSFEITPSDNQNAQFYTGIAYQFAKITRILSYIIVGLSYLLFILGILSGKLIGIETMAVVQIASVSLIALPFVNPCFKSLSNLMFVNGINYFLFQQNYVLDFFLPSSVRGLKLNSHFIKNLNINFLILLFVYFLSVILKIIGKTALISKKAVLSKLNSSSLKCSCQIALNIILLSGYSAGIFISLQFKYAMSTFNGAIQIFSLIETLIFMILFGIYFILLVKYPNNFGQFTILFNNAENFSKDKLPEEEDQENYIVGIIKRKWYNVLLVERILIGIGLGLLAQSELSLIYPICIVILLLLITIIFKQYKYSRHNYRSIANLLTMIIILVIYLGYRVIPLQKQTQVWIYLPLFVCILLLVCIIHNLIMLIYELITERNEKYTVKTEPVSTNRVQQNILSNKTENELVDNQNYYKINKRIKMQVQMLQRTETLANFKDWPALSNQLKTEEIEQIQMF